MPNPLSTPAESARSLERRKTQTLAELCVESKPKQHVSLRYPIAFRASQFGSTIRRATEALSWSLFPRRLTRVGMTNPGD